VPNSPIKTQHHINIIDTRAASTSRSKSKALAARARRRDHGAVRGRRRAVQSYTVDRQMRPCKVPRIAFVNKLDRTGANPYRVRDQLRDKKKLHPVMIRCRSARGQARASSIDRDVRVQVLRR
jgi:hypothetical protein